MRCVKCGITPSISRSVLLHTNPHNYYLFYGIIFTLHTGHLPYLCDLMQRHVPTRSLHSSSSLQFSVLHHSLTLGSRAFQFEFATHYLSVSVNLSHFVLSDVI